MMFGRQLHKIRSGRIFVRGARAEPDGRDTSQSARDRYRDAVMLFGVVEIPKTATVERMHAVRLNSHLWMDIENEAMPLPDYLCAEDMAEFDLGHLMRMLKFSAPLLPDAFEIFLRATMLRHNEVAMRWAYIAGAIAKRLPSLSQDGLYEFNQGEGFHLVDPNPYIGDTPSGIFRKTIWGPDGRYGLATSMEPGRFPSWLAEERERPSYDPEFDEFKRRMADRGVKQRHVYTAKHHAELEAAAKEVCREILNEDIRYAARAQ